MNTIRKKPLNEIGAGFIPSEYIPEGKDEYYIRNKQLGADRKYRQLNSHEIEVLVKNDNSADDWNNIHVSEHFNPLLVKNNSFHGLIRIGDLQNYFLEFHDIPLPVGIYNSNIISCDLGSNISINNVDLISHYIVEDEVILQNINELVTTNYAKFGNGIIKEGEKEELRIWVEVSNEGGGRKIIPFDGMTAGDAWIWSRYRDNTKLMERLKTITQNSFDSKRGYYGKIGSKTVIKHCRILKDVNIGTDAYIKGSNKLKNLTIKSSSQSPSQIGEGVELVNGIIGHGCHVFYGVKAVRFIMDDHTNLKYGARLINSFLGNNSTISCCEVLNALIYPGHEQHHNSSFLIASTILGQSNMASGATVGSNHNSRGNDGEILAGRGFWPGLSISLKHNSCFASFNLIVTGSYYSEINNPFPFSLISSDKKKDALLIIPAYWFRYNMYALARNSWKYGNRDKRIAKKHLLIFDYLAPDTVNEIFKAMELLCKEAEKTEEYRSFKGNSHEFLCNGPVLDQLNADWIENGKREVILHKPSEAYREYRDMLIYYIVKTLVNEDCCHKVILKRLEDSEKRSRWENIGGQLIRKSRIRTHIKAIENDRVGSWDEIHEFYLNEAENYPRDLADHALASLKDILNLEGSQMNIESIADIFRRTIEINRRMAERTASSRKKDYSNPFRSITFASNEERDAVIGRFEDNSFIKKTRDNARVFEKKINEYLQVMIS